MARKPTAPAAAAEPAWLAAVRAGARDRFEAMSWPTPQEEEWRRTDITTLDFAAYRPAPVQPAAAGAAQGSAAGAVPEGLAAVARFRAGVLLEAGLRSDLAAKGVGFASLLASRNGAADAAEPALRAGLERADNRLIAWHYQGLTHGMVLHVPPFVEIAEPFLVEIAEEGDGTLTMPHMTVVLEKGARAVVAVRILSGESDRLLCNAGLEIVVGDAARLAYFEEQRLSPQSTFFGNGWATVGRDAELLHFAASLGGRLAKARLICTMAGPGGTANLNGIYFAEGRQHMDLRTVQHHAAGGSYSRAHYRGAVRDGARTVYQGLIEVLPSAPKTDAYLTNRNLVLNDGARSDSIPSLRINQDDVRCSHGSTTGRIDPEQLFYLQSRGFSPREATQALVTAHFQELADQMPEIMREPVLAALEARA